MDSAGIAFRTILSLIGEGNRDQHVVNAKQIRTKTWTGISVGCLDSTTVEFGKVYSYLFDLFGMCGISFVNCGLFVYCLIVLTSVNKAAKKFYLLSDSFYSITKQLIV